MLLNKRGVALLQVLIIVAILGGMMAMILRVVMSRTTTARQTYRTVTAQMLIESCMAEVNQIWATKTPQTYATDLEGCCMYKEGDTCTQSHTCHTQKVYPLNMNAPIDYSVVASMSIDAELNGRCKVQYMLTPSSGGTAL